MLLAGLCHEARALPTSYYASSSRLSHGHWVKVKVNEGGIHRITEAQLARWGFDDLSKVMVYGFSTLSLSSHNFSISMPDDLPEVPVYRQGGSILFYADADLTYVPDEKGAVSASRNMADLAGYYFITQVDEPSSVSVVPAAVSGSDEVLTSHTSVVYVEPEEDSPLQIGAHYFSMPLDLAGRRFEFPVTHPADGSATLTYNLIGTTKSTAVQASVSVDGLNVVSHTVGKLTDNTTSSPHNRYNRFTVGTMVVNGITDATGNVTVTVKRPSAACVSYCAVDNISLVYQRQNRLDGDVSQLRMFYDGTLAGSPVAFDAPQGRLQVWNITDRQKVTSLPVGPEGVVTLPNTGSCELVAFDTDGSFPTVEFTEEVAPQNLHALPTPTMIIITTGALMEQAEQLAAMHRQYTGIDVAVVDQAQIFNEFSSGSRHVDAYRRFAKMLYDRNRNKLKYLLLMGTAYYDNRGIKGDVSGNLLTFPTENIDYACNPTYGFSSDTFFGMLGDDFNGNSILRQPVTISVGRIPAADPVTVEKYIAKVGEYLENPPLDGSYNRAMLVCDAGNDNGHLIQAESLSKVIAGTDPNVSFAKLYNAIYKTSNGVPVMMKTALSEALARGQGYFCYMGHAGRNSLGAYVSINDIGHYTFGAPPMAFLATCDTYLFDSGSDYIVKELLFTPGGPKAVIGAGRTVYMDNNRVLSEAFAAEYFGGYEGDCIGDVYRRAHNMTSTLSASSEYQRRNNMCYNLAGDPALPVYRPTHSIEVTTIAGSNVNPADTVPVTPGEAVTLTGVVKDKTGNVDTSFNGELIVTLHESARVVNSLLENPDDSKSLPVTVEDNILGQYAATVDHGQWQVVMISPEPLQAGADNRLSLFARSNDRRSAAGMVSGLLAVSQSRADDPSTANAKAPVIDMMYLNTPAFVDGSITGADNILVAHVTPGDNGINFSNSQIGLSTRLILDGNRSYSDARGGLRLNSDGSATLTYNIAGIAEGDHHLQLTVLDNVGNRTQRTLAFHVRHDVDISLMTDRPTARHSVTFDLNHSLDSHPSGRLFIQNAAGHTVYSRSDCSFPFEWNLKDDNGNRLPDGTYRAFATVKTSGLLTSTPVTFFTVIEPR